MKLIISMKLAK